MTDEHASNTDPTVNELGLTEFDLRSAGERLAELRDQWELGRANPREVLVVHRTISQDVLGWSVPTIMTALDGAIERPRALLRAWARAQLACDALRAYRHTIEVVLIPERRRWDAALRTPGVTFRVAGPSYRRPERALRNVERILRDSVREEGEQIEAARKRRQEGHAGAGSDASESAEAATADMQAATEPRRDEGGEPSADAPAGIAQTPDDKDEGADR